MTLCGGGGFLPAQCTYCRKDMCRVGRPHTHPHTHHAQHHLLVTDKAAVLELRAPALAHQHAGELGQRDVPDQHRGVPSAGASTLWVGGRARGTFTWGGGRRWCTFGLIYFEGVNKPLQRDPSSCLGFRRWGGALIWGPRFGDPGLLTPRDCEATLE